MRHGGTKDNYGAGRLHSVYQIGLLPIDVEVPRTKFFSQPFLAEFLDKGGCEVLTRGRGGGWGFRGRRVPPVVGPSDWHLVTKKGVSEGFSQSHSQDKDKIRRVNGKLPKKAET